MRKGGISIFWYILVILVNCGFLVSYGQIIPVTSPDTLLLENNVKALSVHFPDQKSGDKLVIYELSFDESGKVTRKYILSPWDVVSFSTVTTYIYNTDGKLAEEIKEEQIQNLYSRDQDYINSFGNKPMFERISYTYDSDGQLIDKRFYRNSSGNRTDNTVADRTILYSWKNKKLVMEKSLSTDSVIFNQNYETIFEYNEDGKLAVQTRKYGKDLTQNRKTLYSYGLNSNLTDEVITDSGTPRNNAHFQYRYDAAGRPTAKLRYMGPEQPAELLVEYQYDAHGNQVKGEREVTFEYDKNGLIISEKWTDEKADTEVVFVTEYEYYNQP